MKDKLFPVSMLVLVALLMVVIPASAAKRPKGPTFTYTPIATDPVTGNYLCNPTSCGSYTVTEIPAVKRAEWVSLAMRIVWGGNNSDSCLYGDNPSDDPENLCAWDYAPTTLSGYIPNSMAGYGDVCATVTPEIIYYKAGSVVKMYSGETITVCSYTQ